MQKVQQANEALQETLTKVVGSIGELDEGETFWEAINEAAFSSIGGEEHEILLLQACQIAATVSMKSGVRLSNRDAKILSYFVVQTMLK